MNIFILMLKIKKNNAVSCLFLDFNLPKNYRYRHNCHINIISTTVTTYIGLLSQ